MEKQKEFIVIRALVDNDKTEGQVNEFFKEKGFGTIKKVCSVTTKAGQGEKGGRTDIIFLLKSENVMKFGLSQERFGMGISWLSDYLDNDKTIIPTKDYEKLKKLEVSKTIKEQIGELPKRIGLDFKKEKIDKKNVQKLLTSLETINPDEISKEDGSMDFEKLKNHPKVKEVVEKLNKLGVKRDYLGKYFQTANFVIGHLLN